MKERPLRIFVNPQKISIHLHCPICHDVFDQPNRLGCGHTFCYLCIQQWATLSKLCPLCKKSLKHRRPEKDLIAASLIDEMQAKCFHQKCQWTGVYSSLKKHQRTCDFREKKTFEKRNFDDIVELNDDEEMIMNEGKNYAEKNGRKMLKRDNQVELLPVFPQSEGQQLGVNDNTINHASRNVSQTLQSNQQNSSSSSSNIYSQSISNQSNSNSSNSSLSIHLTQLIQNRTVSNMQFLQRLPEQQKDGEYFYKPLKKENQRICEADKHIDLSDQQKQNIDTNYFIIEKNKKEEEKQQKMLQQQKQKNNKWGLGNYIKREKQVQQEMERQYQDVSSSLSSNPFDEPIVEIKKKPAKQYIVIDSSEQSRCERSIESGEMSVNQKQKNFNQKFDQQKTSLKMLAQKQLNHSTMYIPEQYRDSTIECYQSEDKRF